MIDVCRLDATNDLDKVKDWINGAYSEVAAATRYFEGSSATAALVAGATSNALPSALIELEDVTCAYAGVTPPLVQLTWEQLLFKRTYTNAPGGPPLFFSLRKNSLEFWPAAQGGEILTYYGSKQPPAWLSADGDLPDLPEPFSTNLLTYGAAASASEFKNDILMLGNYQQQYQAWLSKFMAFCQRRLGTGSLAFPVYSGSPGTVPHDPSSDFFTYAAQWG